MPKLLLNYPIKPASVNQAFGAQNPMYKEHGINIIGHNGIDFAADEHNIIRAAHEGVVTFCGEDGAGGLGVVIRTNEEKDYKDGTAFFKTIYWHLKKNTFFVKPGDQVKIGTALAMADNTGLSTGTHLHFGLKPVAQGENDWTWMNIEQDNGYFGAIDPSPYWTGYYAYDVVSIMTAMRELLAKLGLFIKGI